MIITLANRDIRGRYKGSVFGFMWNFIIPFVQMIVYVLVFSHLFNHSTENYAVFFLSAMAEWIFISDALSYGSGEIVANTEMINKIYFPRAVLPIAIVLAKIVNYLITLGIVIIIFICLGTSFSAEALVFLPIMVILLILFVTGLTLILSSIDAYFRDIQYLTSVLLTILFWVSPIIYSRSDFSNTFISTILALNPFSYFLESFRDIFYYGVIPEVTSFLICVCLAVFTLIAGFLVFYRLEERFAEVL